MGLRVILRRRRIRRAIILIAALLIALPVTARVWVYLSVRDRICPDVSAAPQSPVALVLGTQALPGGQLSPRLATRCDKAIELYKAGKVKTLLMSGDGRASSNSEPQTMRAYAIKRGVPPSGVIVDGWGMRTYDSIYRAKHVYGFDRLIIVTQRFHLSRSLLIAGRLRIDAHAVPADLPGQVRDQFRECSACLLALGDAYLWTPKPVTDETSPP